MLLDNDFQAAHSRTDREELVHEAGMSFSRTPTNSLVGSLPFHTDRSRGIVRIHKLATSTTPPQRVRHGCSEGGAHHKVEQRARVHGLWDARGAEFGKLDRGLRPER